MLRRTVKMTYLNFRGLGQKSRIRHRFHKECEEGVNSQISVELQASYAYMGLAWIFNHDSVSLPGFYRMFKFMSKEEIDHAWMFVEYQTLRGGMVMFSPIAEPPATCRDGDNWLASVVEQAFDLELKVTKMIESLHSVASKHDDKHLCEFLDSKFIGEQYETLKYLADLRTKIELVKDGSGLYHLDLKLKEKYNKLLEA